MFPSSRASLQCPSDALSPPGGRPPVLRRARLVGLQSGHIIARRRPLADGSVLRRAQPGEQYRLASVVAFHDAGPQGAPTSRRLPRIARPLAATAASTTTDASEQSHRRHQAVPGAPVPAAAATRCRRPRPQPDHELVDQDHARIRTPDSGAPHAVGRVQPVVRRSPGHRTRAPGTAGVRLVAPQWTPRLPRTSFRRGHPRPAAIRYASIASALRPGAACTPPSVGTTQPATDDQVSGHRGRRRGRRRRKRSCRRRA